MLSASEASLPGERCFASAQHDRLESASADSQYVLFEMYWGLPLDKLPELAFHTRFDAIMSDSSIHVRLLFLLVCFSSVRLSYAVILTVTSSMPEKDRFAIVEKYGDCTGVVRRLCTYV